jgi:hypothetical protein
MICAVSQPDLAKPQYFVSLKLNTHAEKGIPEHK